MLARGGSDSGSGATERNHQDTQWSNVTSDRGKLDVLFGLPGGGRPSHNGEDTGGRGGRHVTRTDSVTENEHVTREGRTDSVVASRVTRRSMVLANDGPGRSSSNSLKSRATPAAIYTPTIVIDPPSRGILVGEWNVDHYFELFEHPRPGTAISRGYPAPATRERNRHRGKHWSAIPANPRTPPDRPRSRYRGRRPVRAPATESSR